MDIGDQTTVIGLPKAKAYCHYMGFKFIPKKHKLRYKFGDVQKESIGSITIRTRIKG